MNAEMPEQKPGKFISSNQGLLEQLQTAEKTDNTESIRIEGEKTFTPEELRSSTLEIILPTDPLNKESKEIKISVSYRLNGHLLVSGISPEGMSALQIDIEPGDEPITIGRNMIPDEIKAKPYVSGNHFNISAERTTAGLSITVEDTSTNGTYYKLEHSDFDYEADVNVDGIGDESPEETAAAMAAKQAELRKFGQ